VISTAHGNTGSSRKKVTKGYPELVIRDAKGQIPAVHYDELAPMLANKIQQQQQKIAAQDTNTRGLEQQLAQVQVALLNRARALTYC
jgi:hypothetical protein